MENGRIHCNLLMKLLSIWWGGGDNFKALDFNIWYMWFGLLRGAFRKFQCFPHVSEGCLWGREVAFLGCIRCVCCHVFIVVLLAGIMGLKALCRWDA